MVPKLSKLERSQQKKKMYLFLLLHLRCPSKKLPLQRCLIKLFDLVFYSIYDYPLKENPLNHISNDVVQSLALPAPPHWPCAALLHYAVLPASPGLTPLRIHSFHLPASLHPAAKEHISTLY